VANVHGWIAGKSAKGEGVETLPVIAVMASYDSLGVAPEFAVGADANGSLGLMKGREGREGTSYTSTSRPHTLVA